MLCDKAVFIVSYDFINSKISDYEIIALSDLVKIKYGNLKYPDGTWMPEYAFGAVRLLWGEEQMGFLAKWSVFENSKYKTFTSHHIIYNEKEKETQFWNCDEFINSLEMGLSCIFHRIILKSPIKNPPTDFNIILFHLTTN